MAKVHRMHRRDWWVPSFQQKGWMQSIENGTFGQIPIEVRSQERYALPFTCYEGDGEPLHIPCENLLLPVPARPTPRYSGKRVGEPGIPANVDIQAWYAAYLKHETLQQEKALKTGEEKREYYRDVAIDLYRASGYGLGECVEKAYSPQGDELVRYLADDKRHKLNRTQEDEEEVTSAM